MFRKLDESLTALNALHLYVGKHMTVRMQKKKKSTLGRQKCGLTLENKGGNMARYQVVEGLGPPVLESKEAKQIHVP